jgi:transposase
MGTLLMSESERRRLAVFSQVQLKQIRVAKAGRVLGISERQARRLWKRFKQEGDSGLVHRLRGRPGNAGHGELRRRVLKRCRERYREFGPAHAAEHLAREGLVVPAKTLWRWLKAENLVATPRRSGRHRIRRERKPCIGELIQMDGSAHDWLSGRGPRCVLFVMVDDATGFVFCRFYESEETQAAFDLFGRYVKKHGLPQALYVDKDSIYRVNDPKAREKGLLSGRMPLTQFGRAMKQLGVGIIAANSPQAKGRVERMNGTLQERLVKELTLAGARSIQEANAYLEKTFLKQFNQRFTRRPSGGANLHRALSKQVKLGDVLCVIETRTVGRDWCISHGSQVLQIDKRHEGLSLAGRKVEVHLPAKGPLKIRYCGKDLRYQPVTMRPVKKKVPQAPVVTRQRWRPGPNHPWNREARQGRSAPASLAALACPPLRSLDGPGG